jgi:hypothetical protein
VLEGIEQLIIVDDVRGQLLASLLARDLQRLGDPRGVHFQEAEQAGQHLPPALWLLQVGVLESEDFVLASPDQQLVIPSIGRVVVVDEGLRRGRRRGRSGEGGEL